MELLGAEDLLLMRLPDESVGALRRGQVFRVDSANSIDIDGEFSSPTICPPFVDPTDSQRSAAWVLTQEDPPILLIRGTELI